MRCRSLILAATLALAGCSGDDGDSSSPDPEAASPSKPAPAAARPSAGCGKTAPKAGTRSIQFRGERRTYQLALPEGYDPAKPVPVVLNLHGLGSNAGQQVIYTQLPSEGASKGFAVVTPDHSRKITGWRLPRMKDGNADIAFAGGLLDHLEKTLCVDRGREFAAGMSNGAGLSAALVCGLKGRLAAVAPVAGVNLAEPCADAKPTTIIAFHGTSDKIVPYAGGEPYGSWNKVPAWMRPPGQRPDLPKVEEVMNGWARAFGCGPAQDSPGSVRLRRHGGCRDGVTVAYYTVPDGGHTWPGAIDIPRLGKTSQVIKATDLLLSAFTRTPAR